MKLLRNIVINIAICLAGAIIISSPIHAEAAQTTNDNIYSLSYFGGKSNDSSFDNSPILNRAITELNRKGGGTIVLEVGTYSFRSNIVISENVENVNIQGITVGNRTQGSNIHWYGNGTMIHFTGEVQNCSFDTFSVMCDSNSFLEFDSLYSSSNINELMIRGCVTAITVNAFENIYVDNLTILTSNSFNDRVVVFGNSDDTKSNGLYFTNCSIDGNSKSSSDALVILSGNNIYLNECDLCNFTTGCGIVISNYRKQNNICINGCNLTRCNGGLKINARKNITELYIINQTIIFMGNSATEKGIVLSSANKAKIDITISNYHTRKIGSQTPENIITCKASCIADSSTYNISQNLSGGAITLNGNDNFISSDDNLIDTTNILYDLKEASVQKIRLAYQNLLRQDFYGIYHIEDFGTVVNNKSFDNGPVIRSAIEKVRKTGGILIFTSDDYYIASNIQIEKRLDSVKLQGSSDTCFLWTGKNYLFQFESLWWSRIDNIKMICSNNSAIDITGLVFKSRLSNVYLQDAIKGINLGDFAYAFLEDITVDSQNKKTEFGLCIGSSCKTTEYLYINDCSFIGNRLSRGSAIIIDKASFVYMNNVAASGWKDSAISVVAKANPTAMLYFNNIDVTDCSYGIYYLPTVFVGITVVSNMTFNINTDNTDYHAVYLAQTSKNINSYLDIYNFEVNCETNELPKYFMYVNGNTLNNQSKIRFTDVSYSSKIMNNNRGKLIISA